MLFCLSFDARRRESGLEGEVLGLTRIITRDRKFLAVVIDVTDRHTASNTSPTYIPNHARACAVQSLRAQDDKSHTLANIVDSWTQRVPDGSKDALNLAITQQAIEIMVMIDNQDNTALAMAMVWQVSDTALNWLLYSLQ